MPRIYFIDVTNRDGVQTARIALSKLQKTMVNVYLGELGIHQSECGFPFTRHEQHYITGNVELQQLGAMGSLVLSGWCRAIPKDVQASLPTGIRDFNLSISTSDQMIAHKFRGKLDRQAIIREMVEAVHTARAAGARTIGVNAEDASRTDMGYLIEFAQAGREAGANRIRYCDTLGTDSPISIHRRVKQLGESVGLPVELHCHNDLGMAVANSVMGAQGAMEAGVDAWINATVNGIGERAGNADLLSCILAVKYAGDLRDYCEIADNLDLTAAYRLAQYTSYALGIPIPINQPGVGANVFAHESGIHADGVLKDRHNYELFDYEVLGRGEPRCEPTGRVVTTGEYGGVAGMKHVYQGLGITFPTDAEAHRILELVQYANAQTQLPLTDGELRLIANYPEQVRKILTVNP
ncbi:MAG: homocitrate synthase [Chloroflexi bacterium]|nr:homocitrate synthase [Chloroflexota bacterium]